MALKADGMPAHQVYETVSRLDATMKSGWTAVTGRSSSSRGNSPPR
ncbi:hypothetical protein ABZ235_29940 [Streptomyces canus]